jgi:uncharacterized membrane protein
VLWYRFSAELRRTILHPTLLSVITREPHFRSQLLTRTAHPMKSPNVDAARRLDRLLRLQFLRNIVLLTGWLMTIIGLLAVFMSVRLPTDQRFAMLSVNPKDFLFNTPWLPAPPHFRIVGSVLLILGIALVSLTSLVSSKKRSRAAASSASTAPSE